MKLTVKKEEIIEGFLKASGIIPSKAGATYLRSVWLQAQADNSFTIMATDVNIEFTGTYPAQVEEAGKVGVNGKAMVDLMRKLPNGEIKLVLDSETNNLLVQQGRRSYKLPAADPVWFQALPPFPEEGAVLWAGDYFQEILEKVSFCIHDDETQEALACLYLKNTDSGKVDVCGLNGHQFSMIRFVNDDISAKIGDSGLLLLKKYVNEIKKWLASDEIMFNLSERRFHIRNSKGTEHLSVPRSGFNYPDYMNFLSRLNAPDATKLKLNRKECLEALDRLNIFNSDNDKCTYFKLDNNVAILSAQAQETGSAVEELDVEYEGVLEKIAFPTKNLMDILGHFQSENLEWTLTGSEGPCSISGSEDPDYMVLIMPMKIAESSYYSE